ncbi:hypothetical protein MHC_02425 [Mycoplasma haemocanis str. Illinois]|uniref:Uncharacterized protein n=1 Tax=Mycoplasma haemocanis (strain Illinois) TaxID=1111676 RepID=H6N6S7_MYCHN|nr:hypothetical protein [Mycoplasma haemocanis]AEW45349.1 hypothetical protein MHC_02425 [Mycoplasma haemocanis str. Illinois]
MSIPAKLLFGSIGLSATGIGLGVEKIVFFGSKNSTFPAKSKSVAVKDKEKECRIHKLITARDAGKFQRVEKEDLKREIEKQGRGDYKSVEDACLKNAGKDIFVSNPQGTGWKYLQDTEHKQGEKVKFENYLKGV